jgi:peptidoglycan/LPS O-acetylase OafA/YrhL
VTKDRISAIDALRGVAALLVVVYHVRAELWVGTSYFWHNPALRLSPEALLGYLSIPFSCSFLGVQLLFVISGYCIHRNNARKLALGVDDFVSWRAYLLRRFWRIYPTFFAALVLTWMVDSLPTVFSSPGPGQSDSLRTAVANLLALQGFVAPYFGSNNVLWTLAIEIHFYLVYPFLFIFRRKFGVYRTIGAVFAISLLSSSVILLFNVKSVLPFWQIGCPIFLVYWFTWACGFFIAEAEFSSARLPNHLMLIASGSLAVALAMHELGIQPLDELLFAIAAGSAVAMAIRKKGFSGKFTKFLEFVGVFSYSLYITHRILIGLFKNLIPGVSAPHVSLFVAIVIACVCVGFGWFFYQIVECWSLGFRPFETLVPGFRRRPVRPPVPVV